ncbi:MULTISPECIES: hypothetical protein [unclassified Pseudomonas]|uniref:hypothetical protein n=1 Tax=unclassified Pseudomonas TaxID=196821 RepID=UPI002AC8FBE8|nr:MULTISPECIES: hypothetical protein [unclassified Pseudomonas]MEB0043404.1 hypothetical protein [Pseudomonas sp. MH10]MEB0123722.1 hypothetical protein [Pseudomonas sp. CCI1.2]WPX66303.1 hypothetical protein RHM59_11945 [Pseudomonas sp. MH10]
MTLLIHTAAALLLLSSLPLAAAPSQSGAKSIPMHAQYLPPDDQTLREGNPTQQQLLQITEYSVVIGSQRESTQQPIPVTSPVLLRLKGRSMNKGATVFEVLLHFDGESKSLKKPTFDDQSHTLSLYYPMTDYRAVIDLLRNEKVYCQFLSYANGHVWADLHTTELHAR